MAAPTEQKDSSLPRSHGGKRAMLDCLHWLTAVCTLYSSVSIYTLYSTVHVLPITVQTVLTVCWRWSRKAVHTCCVYVL